MPRVSAAPPVFFLLRPVCHFLNFTFFGINIYLVCFYIIFSFRGCRICALGSSLLRKDLASVGPYLYANDTIRKRRALALELNIRTEGLKRNTSALKLFRSGNFCAAKAS